MDIPTEAQPPVVLRTPNRGWACGLHLVPRGPGGLYVGATKRPTSAPATGVAAGEQLHLLHGLLHQFRSDLRTATISGIRWGPDRPRPTVLYRAKTRHLRDDLEFPRYP
jgi:glycine oxidase